jgi:hypothetical protein
MAKHDDLVVYKDHGRPIAHDNGRGTEYHRFTCTLKAHPALRGYGHSEAEALADLRSRSRHADEVLSQHD